MLAQFRAGLKEILAEGEPKSLILYGSRARGDARPTSDIDVLVVYDPANGDKKYAIRELADELLYAARTEFEIQPLVLTEKELAQDAARGLPLLHNIAREGIVLEGEQVTPRGMDRKHWADIHLADARRTLRTARLVLADGDLKSAISLAYFIYLDAARAALITKGIAPQSHGGTKTLFGLHFIKPGLLPKKFGPLFERLETDRLEATYRKQREFTPEDAERALARAEELVTTVENLLPTWLGEQ
jgi:uncharacterized protein (UPF0332 family)/predicted nucleotidyltransferase